MKRIITAQRDNHESQREINNRRLAYQAALEGIVLLKNNGVLPLEKCDLALYGAGAKYTVKGGSGSGEVNERYSATIYDGLKEKGFNILTDSCLDEFSKIMTASKEAYNEMIKEKYTIFDIWGLVFTMPIADEIKEEDLVDCDTAIFVVARQAGEGKDRRLEDGFCLSEKEVRSIRLCSEHYKRFILIINSGSSVDLSSVDDCHIDAIIYFCQQGLEGGRALASLLTGEENFSGKLTDTWVNSYDDVPFGNEYSYLNGDTEKEYYREGIYVGYRYYDTFNIPVRYHFGYGLSYTDFEIRTLDTELSGRTASLKVAVKNIGKCAGKEIVQVYASCPEGKLDKEYQRLVAFTKTKKLEPDEEEILELSFDLGYCASYDEEERSFILEKGDYLLRAGDSSNNTVPVSIIRNNQTIILSKHDDLMPCKEDFEELHAPKRISEDIADLKVLDLDPSCFETIVYTYSEMEKCHDPLVEKIMDTMSPEDKVDMVIGEIGPGNGRPTNYIYTPGSVARTSQKFVDRGVINVNLADGPAGIRLLKESALDKDGNIKYIKGNYPVAAMELFVEERPIEKDDILLYQYPTAWPVATALAQSFNTELIEKIGRTSSEEMVEFNVTYWLTPGMNIHRNPLCGRNFEYYSEDPLLTGKLAAALLKGAQSISGNYITIKHLACNNAEENRTFSDSIIHQRALREIYLRGFELAVREGKASGAMTSYNKINGVFAPDNYDLAVKILRDEWGFDGVLMTDWTATLEGHGDNAKAIKAGHIIMPGGPYYREAILKALKEGTLKEEELDIPVSQLLYQILHSNVASRIKAEDLL